MSETEELKILHDSSLHGYRFRYWNVYYSLEHKLNPVHHGVQR